MFGFLLFVFIVIAVVWAFAGSGGGSHGGNDGVEGHGSSNGRSGRKRDYYGSEISTPYDDDDFDLPNESLRDEYLLAMEGDIDASDIDDFDEGDVARYGDDDFTREDDGEW